MSHKSIFMYIMCACNQAIIILYYYCVFNYYNINLILILDDDPSTIVIDTGLGEGNGTLECTNYILLLREVKLAR